jgi:hypothetical protein
MQLQHMPQKARSAHAEQGSKVLSQDVCHAELVMAMRFLQVGQIPLEAIFAFPFFNLGFHEGNI